MTGNEKLIEEAAKAMADGEHNALGWRGHSEDEREWYRKDAAIALAVFEKAHTPTGNTERPNVAEHLAFTPTDDEREAPEMDDRGWADYADWRASRDPETGAPHWDWIDGYRAALCRSEIPEPSADPRTAAVVDYLMSKQVTGSSYVAAPMGDAMRLVLGVQPAPEPQGEPSSAQVDDVAKAIAVAANADYWTDEIAEWEGSEAWEREAHPDNHPHTAYEDREEFRKQARAALRAAGGVR